MDKFIVSARKYRPQTFDTVVGQHHITTTLKNAIKNKQLAHAFLFCGPRGVGKTTCARILAKTINCENPQPDGEACNACQSCVSFNEGASMNIHELDAASNNSVDDIRTLVEQVRFAPQAGEYKVYIIDEVHMLSASAFNAFLKTLEEPPPYAIFILATTEKHKILPTILSRCQIFDFKRITASDTVGHLEDICKKENIQAEKAALQVIAQKSEGCMRDALSILDKIVSFTNGEATYAHTLEHLNILDADYYFRLMQRMQDQDLAGAMLLFDDIIRKGFDEELILNGFSEFIRNLLVCKDEKIAFLLEVVESFKERYAQMAKTISAGYLVSALQILNETEINYKAARNKRLHVELALIRLTYLEQALRIALSGEELVKKKQTDIAKPVSFRQIPAMQPVKPKTVKTEARLTIQDDPAAFAAASAKASAAEAEASTTNTSTTNTSTTNTATSTAKASAQAVKAETSIVGPATKKISSEENRQSLSQKAEKQPEGTALAKASAAISNTSTANTATSTAKASPQAVKADRLENIRKQIADRSLNAEKQQIIPLDEEKLQEAWRQYSQRLRENKNPAAQSFDIARLAILDEQQFEVIANNNLEQRFIEQEKRMLSEYLQAFFCNQALHFTVRITENPSLPDPGERPLSRKEQFQQMSEQYPLVKELKDKLHLELDY
ncbi:MAG TPA: DNA polymerase III subunit gamma/tau [Flavitalea sp.]|nr:DNA polymerase III subunit gamma/tau [Flavitalea sp.]